MQMLTIHGFTLKTIVAIILGKEELEISFGILDIADLIFVVDEVAVKGSVEARFLKVILPQAFKIMRKDWVLGKTARETSKHVGGFEVDRGFDGVVGLSLYLELGKDRETRLACISKLLKVNFRWYRAEVGSQTSHF